MTSTNQSVLNTLDNMHGEVAVKLSEGIKHKEPLTRVKYCGLARIFLKHNGIKADPMLNDALASLADEVSDSLDEGNSVDVPFMDAIK